MSERKFIGFCIDSLLEAGAEKAQCFLTEIERHELNVEIGELSLLRTMRSANIRLEAIRGGKRGVVSVGSMVPGDVRSGAKAAVAASGSSSPDSAWDIAAKQAPGIFTNGVTEPDREKMLSSVQALLTETAKSYPKIRIRNASLEFTKKTEQVLNSNAVSLASVYGAYKLFVNFAAHDKKNPSSINFFSVGMPDLSRPLIKCGLLDELFRRAEQQIITTPVKGKFTGDIVVMPHCLDYFLDFVCGAALTSRMLIPGTSVYRDMIGKRITSKSLTLRSLPLSPEISTGYYFTRDGYRATDSVIIEKGILRSFLLDSYGARKTGLARAANDGGCLVADPGKQKYESLIKKVKKGLLISRFSGAAPNEAGNFSGVAKNSFYIEDGKILFPVSETMVSGNIPKMLENINGLSSERINLGNSVLPWISFSGVQISGKQSR